MRIISSKVRGSGRLARVSGPSRMARQRLKWMDYNEAHGKNAALTCHYFGISRQTFYRWKRRYNPRDPTTLEERSHRPQRVRQPTWSPELAQAVLELREERPRWGEDKLAVLLQKDGWQASVSMVGRILTSLKARGVLREPPANGISARKRQRARPYAVRKPKQYQAKEPGDLVQVDTLDVRPLPGVVLKHFTARDVVSRWDVVEVHTRATATTAKAFLDALQARLPFPLKAIQVDGGSESQASFEQACQQRGVHLFVLPPRSPKLNGHLGTPPATVDWQWKDKDGQFHRDGTLTPLEFAEKHVPTPLDEYVCLVHDPRKTSPMGRTFTIAYLGNIVEAPPIKYLNVDIEVIKDIALRQLQNGRPVWMGCDTSKQMNRELGLWDSELFDYAGVYGADFSLDKEARLEYHQARMTHAMLFTGVDVVDGKPRRWRVENSWNDKVGEKGFFLMNDSWFAEYMFEIAAPKSYLHKDLRKALDLDPIVLPPWDPMGSQAAWSYQGVR